MMVLLNIVCQHLPQEWPWTLPRPEFGWFELMLANNSQKRYRKEHVRMRKDTFLQLVDPVTPEISWMKYEAAKSD